MRPFDCPTTRLGIGVAVATAALVSDSPVLLLAAFVGWLVRGAPRPTIDHVLPLHVAVLTIGLLVVVWLVRLGLGLSVPYTVVAAPSLAWTARHLLAEHRVDPTI
jgi:hypothetical protein